MSKSLAQFHLKDGTEFLVEVEEPEEGGLERVAAPFGFGRPVKAKGPSFEEMLDKVKPVASTIVEKLRGLTTPADEVAVKFGLKLTAEAGVVFTSLGSEVTYEISLKWQEKSVSTADSKFSVEKLTLNSSR